MRMHDNYPELAKDHPAPGVCVDECMQEGHELHVFGFVKQGRRGSVGADGHARTNHAGRVCEIPV